MWRKRERERERESELDKSNISRPMHVSMILTPGALAATLRRLCAPKKSSGKLEVSAEIHKQWAAGGKSRKALMSILVKCKGDKDQCFKHYVSKIYSMFMNFHSPDDSY